MARTESFSRIVDGAFLKKAAVVTMLIDHVGYALFECVWAYGKTGFLYGTQQAQALDAVLRGIGRTAFPIFCFLIAEGFLHTRNRLRYALRLLAFAFISEIPFYKAFFPFSHRFHCDTIFTLFMGLCAIWAWDIIVGDDDLRKLSPGILAGKVLMAGGAAGAMCTIASVCGMDYRHGGVLTVLIFYIFRKNRLLSVLAAYAALCAYNADEVFSFGGFALIQCYNGTKGKQNRWFFYVFYPVHLLVLYLIRKSLYGF